MEKLDQISFLPFSMEVAWEKFKQRQETPEEECQLINLLFKESVVTLGRFSLLEYIQSGLRNPKLDFWLFSQKISDEAFFWCEVMRKTLFFLYESKHVPVLHNLFSIYEKYPSLRNSQLEDRLQRLLWFYNWIKNSFALACDADLEEYRGQLKKFIADLFFLQKVHYEVYEGQTHLFYEEKSLCLSPLFHTRLQGSEGLQLYLVESDVLLKNFYCQWLPEDFRIYQQECEGNIRFENFTQKYEDHYILLPWLEISLDELFEETLSSPSDMQLKRIMITGPPASGKTALAINCPKIFTSYKMESFFFVTNKATRKLESFLAWFEKNIEPKVQEINQTSSSEKLILLLDGVDTLSFEEQRQLENFAQEKLYFDLVFVFFQRSHVESPLSWDKKIELSAQDNIYFLEKCSSFYIKILLERYQGQDSITKETLRFLGNHYDEGPFTIQDIAKKLALYPPLILKSIKKIKPLLKVSFDKRKHIPLFSLCHKGLSLGKIT